MVNEIAAILKQAQIKPMSHIRPFFKLESENLDFNFFDEYPSSWIKNAQTKKAEILKTKGIQRICLQFKVDSNLPRILKEVIVAIGILRPNMPIANPLSSILNICAIRANVETSVMAPPRPIIILPIIKSK